MQYKSLPRALRIAGISAIALCSLAFLAARLSHSAATSVEEQKKRLWAEQVHSFVCAGLGKEVTLAHRGACPEDVRVSVDSVTNFIHERSGLVLDQSTTDRLADIEWRVLNGERRRIKTSELGAVLTGIAAERIQNSTDAEIGQIADGLANVITFSR